MMKSLLSVAASLIFFAAVSVAQSTPADSSQGTQGSSPTSQQDPSVGQGSSAGQSSGSMGQDSSTMSQGSEMKGEKKMKGCIRSEGGQYSLEDKHGKTTPLSGQDLSAHVGHEVTVHGMLASGSSSGASETASGSMGSSGKSLNVTKVDMISETCSLDKNKSKSSSDSMQKPQ